MHDQRQVRRTIQRSARRIQLERINLGFAQERTTRPASGHPNKCNHEKQQRDANPLTPGKHVDAQVEDASQWKADDGQHPARISCVRTRSRGQLWCLYPDNYVLPSTSRGNGCGRD